MANKKKNKKTLEQELKRDKIMLIITSIIIVILLSLLIVSRNYRDFSLINLRTNNKTIFSISDLTINDLKYGTNEEDVRKKFGTPDKEKQKEKNNYKYKELFYNGLKLTLKENYDDYMLVGVKITNKKYKISRNIRVSNNISKTMKKFKVENKTGTYMYGNYSSNALNSEEVSENIYFGVRNSSQILYVNRDAKVSNVQSNIAKLYIYYKYGKITKIEWSYDFD